MKTINLEKEKIDLSEVIDLARKEPVLLLTSDGKEFIVTEADNFEKEIEILRCSHSFQQFLDERSTSKIRMPLEEIEKKIEQELSEREEHA